MIQRELMLIPRDNKIGTDDVALRFRSFYRVGVVGARRRSFCKYKYKIV
jgi:hypothetical protein